MSHQLARCELQGVLLVSAPAWAIKDRLVHVVE